MNTLRDVYENIGAAGEEAVRNLIEARGHTVRWDGANALHDIVVNGSTTVEVKTAHPSPGSNGNKQRWQFHLFKNDGHHQPMLEDILVLRCLLPDDQARHFIIPGRCLRPKQRKIDITSHPDQYRGQYAPFREAWQLLDKIIAHNDVRGVQIPLFTRNIPF